MSSQIMQFAFQTKPIRSIIDDRGEIWFAATDVAEALGYKNKDEAVRRHCRRQRPLSEIPLNPTPRETRGVYTSEDTDLPRENILMIPESDLYRLMMRSNLKVADAFQDWVCDEVLPSIRKTGKYATTKNQLLLENQQTSLVGFEAFSKLNYSQKISVHQTLKDQGNPVANYLALDSHVDTAYIPMAKLSKKLGYDKVVFLENDLEQAGLLDERQFLTEEGHKFAEYRGYNTVWSMNVITKLQPLWDKHNERYRKHRDERD